MLTDARDLSQQLRVWRDHLHRHPELSFQEHATQAYLREQLQALGLRVQPIADTGLLVDLSASEDPDARAPVVALRADMDALPIQELEGRPHGSQVDGVMHACGHDAHMTCLLGAAALLLRHRGRLGSSIRLIFQPGEELLPGGATRIIAEGGLEGVGAICALHVDPSLPVGKFGTRPGAYMASADEVYLTLRGTGGHGALAHKHVDLLATQAQLLVGLQQVVSRKAPPDVPTVLSFGHIESFHGATNVLADRVELAGTLRTYDEAWRSEAHGWIRRIAQSTAQAFGAELDVEIRKGYPALSNDDRCHQTVLAALQDLVGQEQVKALALRPTAEDFAWYLQHVPGCFFRLGVRNEATGITHGVHTAAFDVDPDALAFGAAGLAVAAIRLSQQAPLRASVV